MKITKILAMLLALCMLVCCFAACNKKDEEKKDGEKTEETKAEETKAEGIVGEWEGKIDFGKMLSKIAGMDIDAVLELTYNFEFAEDGKYKLNITGPSDSKVVKFVEDVLEIRMDAMMEENDVSSKEELAQTAGYDSFDEFYQEGYDSTLELIEGMIDGLAEGQNGEYKYEDGTISFDEGTEEAFKLEVELSGDNFTIKSADDEDADLVFGGAKFERK